MRTTLLKIVQSKEENSLINNIDIVWFYYLLFCLSIELRYSPKKGWDILKKKKKFWVGIELYIYHTNYRIIKLFNILLTKWNVIWFDDLCWFDAILI